MATPFPFVSGATLTAAQMNAITTLPVSTKTGSYVLTSADIGTRVVMNSASATTITVNTSIFGASDKVEILNIGAGVCTVTAGTCTVGTTGTLALAQNAGGTLTFISASASVFTAGDVAASASGLTFINGASFTGVATVDSPINTFTSTYANYLVILDIQTLASFAAVYWRFSTAGTPITSATYDWAGISIRSSGTTFPGGSGASTQFYVGDCGNIEYSSFQFTVINPQISARNSKIIWAGPHADGTYYYHTTASGRNATAASHDGFRILNSGGVNMTGSYKVYGYSNS